MDEKYVKAFNAVVGFVGDLWSVFGSPKKASPLALYRRLIDHIKFTDEEAINKVLCGFRQFLVIYEDAIINNNLDSIPRGTVIKYGEAENIFIEVQKFIYQTKNDPETREAIRQHLITISTILEPNSKKLEELDKRLSDLNLNLDSKEGEFITGIMHKAKDTMESADINDPTQAIFSLMGSNVIQDMVAGLQHGVSSGEMDIQKLLGSMQTAIGTMMPPVNNSPPKKPIEEIKDEEVD